MSHTVVIRKLSGSWLPILEWCEEHFDWRANKNNWYINYTEDPNFTITLNNEEEVTLFWLRWAGENK